MAFRPAPVDNAGQREVISQQAQDRRRLPGRLAQLVEHLVYTEEVGGSTPSPPTTLHHSGSDKFYLFKHINK